MFCVAKYQLRGVRMHARVASVVTMMSIAAASVQAQSISEVGVTPGAAASAASAVSANGAMVAATIDMLAGHRWSLGTLSSITPLPGAIGFSADDISASGEAVAGSIFYEVPEETVRAYRWTQATGMEDLGTLPGGTAAIGNGISGDGNVVTGASFDADFNATAFRWTSGGGMQSLGLLPGGSNSEGRRLSHDGNAIVGVADSPEGNRAFLWTASGGMQNLGLFSATDEYSSAFGVNADGSVVAGFSGTNAVIWNNGVAQSLGMLPGSDSAIAYALSGDGSLVGGYSFQGFSARATLWSASLGLVDLNTYLPTLGIDLTGWTLSYTRDISFDGTTIVGEGSFNGQWRGWVVTIPAPGSLAIAAAGGLLVSRRRRVL